jgi:hypothetical protein
LYTSQLPSLLFTSISSIQFVSLPFSKLIRKNQKKNNFSENKENLSSNSALNGFLLYKTDSIIDFLGCPVCHRCLMESYLSCVLKMIYYCLNRIAQLKRHSFYLVHIQKIPEREIESNVNERNKKYEKSNLKDNVKNENKNINYNKKKEVFEYRLRNYNSWIIEIIIINIIIQMRN